LAASLSARHPNNLFAPHPNNLSAVLRNSPSGAPHNNRSGAPHNNRSGAPRNLTFQAAEPRAAEAEVVDLVAVAEVADLEAVAEVADLEAEAEGRAAAVAIANAAYNAVATSPIFFRRQFSRFSGGSDSW
jgi:hypothetical protein